MVIYKKDSQYTGDTVTLRLRIARFAMVGTLCLIFQWILVQPLHMVMHLYFADAIAFLCSAQLNFLLSFIWTWGDRTTSVGELESSWRTRWLKFNTSAIMAAVAVNPTAFTILYSWIELRLWAALLIANITSTAFTFCMNHFIVFRPPPIPASELQERLMPVPITSVAFFMPAHNEAENLPTTVERAHAYFDEAGISNRTVIVVDDGSTDNTQDVLQDVAASYPLHLVNHDVNRGYGGALRSGFLAALETGHDWIAFCDSDGQFHPADLQLLIDAAMREDAKVILGFREARADNWKRRAAGRTWHHLSQFILGFKAQDVDCGFKLFHREALQKVAAQLNGEHAAISPELLARLKFAGYKFSEVAIPHYPRSCGEQSGLKLHVAVGSVFDLFSLRHDIHTVREYA